MNRKVLSKGRVSGLTCKILIERGLIVLIALVIGACSKPKQQSEQAETTPSEPTEPATSTPAEATPAPASEPPKVTATATPEPPQLAPHGVYFLVAATSVETSDGIVGLKPGTQLQLLSPGKYMAGQHQVTLRADQVTNDLRVARRVAGQEAAAQASLRKSAVPPPGATTTPAASTSGTPATAAGSTPRPRPAKSAFDVQLENIRARRAAIKAEINRNAQEQTKLMSARGNQRGWDYLVKTSPNAGAVQRRRDELQKSLDALDAEEDKVQESARAAR